MQEDPIALIQKLQKKYVKFGAVKLIAAEDWNSPFSFKYATIAMTTRVQPIHQLKQGKVRLFESDLTC
jgi:hypothetical protein